MAKPVKTFKLGQVSAAVWENQKKDGKKSYSVTFQKSYKDRDGKWQNTDFFFDSDLLALKQLISAMMDKKVKVFENKETLDEPPINDNNSGPDVNDIPF